MSAPMFRIGAEGVDERDVNERCVRANADRRATGLIEEGEAEWIARTKPKIPLVPWSASGEIVEALRLMQRAAQVEEPAPITSHRPLFGPFLVAVKRAMRRVLRFETAEPWRRQAEFNRAVAAFARAILAELARIEAGSGGGNVRRDGPADPPPEGTGRDRR